MKPWTRTAVSWFSLVLCVAAAWGIVWWSGLSFNTVLTSSMVPTYNPGDIVITLGPRAITPRVGKAIVFETDFYGTHIPPHVHRIVAQKANGTWETRGDANPQPDPWDVHPQSVHGTAIAALPGHWVRNPVMIGMLVALILVISFWPSDAEAALPRHGDPESAERREAEVAAGPRHRRRPRRSRDSAQPPRSSGQMGPGPRPPAHGSGTQGQKRMHAKFTGHPPLGAGGQAGQDAQTSPQWTNPNAASEQESHDLASRPSPTRE